MPYRAATHRDAHAVEEVRRILDQAGIAILRALRLLEQLRTRPARHVAVPRRRP